jgi:hypothetical protein
MGPGAMAPGGLGPLLALCPSSRTQRRLTGPPGAPTPAAAQIAHTPIHLPPPPTDTHAPAHPRQNAWRTPAPRENIGDGDSHGQQGRQQPGRAAGAPLRGRGRATIFCLELHRQSKNCRRAICDLCMEAAPHSLIHIGRCHRSSGGGEFPPAQAPLTRPCARPDAWPPPTTPCPRILGPSVPGRRRRGRVPPLCSLSFLAHAHRSP